MKTEIYRDVMNRWRARVRARNGKIVFSTSEGDGYHRRIDVVRMARKYLKKGMPIVFILLALFLTIGCGSFFSRQYLYSPSVFERAAQRAALNKVDGQPSPTSVVVSDLDIVEFNDAVEQAWRKRDQLARGVDLGAEAAEAGLGIVPVIMTALNFAWPVGPIISGVSTLISKFVSMVNPSVRIEAYADGIGLLSDAKAEYFKALGDGQVPDKKMTEHGMALLKKTNYAIAVVEKTVAGRVPTAKEVTGATSTN